MHSSYQAEVEALRAQAAQRCRTALIRGDRPAALQAQLAMMAAEGLLDDRLAWAEAVLDVGQTVADIRRLPEG
jgi:hypothetical protein